MISGIHLSEDGKIATLDTNFTTLGIDCDPAF